MSLKQSSLKKVILLALAATEILREFIAWQVSRSKVQDFTVMIEDNEHMEDLGFIWSIPTSDLLSMFRILYAQELTPEEMLDHLYLVSDRQYFITDDDGSRMQIPEEVHFKIRAAQEPDIFDVDGLDD